MSIVIVLPSPPTFLLVVPLLPRLVPSAKCSSSTRGRRIVAARTFRAAILSDDDPCPPVPWKTNGGLTILFLEKYVAARDLVVVQRTLVDNGAGSNSTKRTLRLFSIFLKHRRRRLNRELTLSRKTLLLVVGRMYSLVEPIWSAAGLGSNSQF